MNDIARNRIEAQLAEMELLMSMYTNQGELEFDDQSELADLRAAATLTSSDDATSHVGGCGGLGFTLHLTAMQVCCLIVDCALCRLHWNRRLLCETWLFTTVGYIWRKPVLTYAISVVIY